jgi:hypothetical protein
MIDNCFAPAFEARGTTVDKWGKDQTGLVQYRFNNSGFRSDFEYTAPPEYALFGASAVFGVGIPLEKTICALLPNCQNYGLGGNYYNHHSVANLKNFIHSPLYRRDTKIVFFWIDRPGVEDIESMITEVNSICPDVLHINLGAKVPGAITLFSHVDQDVSGTQPGPRTHAKWAKTIELLFKSK